jgi:DNA (cytosine-5)-methyltransferase 1
MIKYVDLCSGIGGFRLAIENYNNHNTNLDFKCILSVDIKQDAIDTYNLNFKENNSKLDINMIEPSNMEKFDLLCAGFPCQPFSSAGGKKGFSDGRGNNC